jgi:hypothetical protein
LKSGLEMLAHLSQCVPATQERKQKNRNDLKRQKEVKREEQTAGKKDFIIINSSDYSEFQF